MKEEIEFYINENGIACVPLKMYNDSLGEIEKLNYIIDKQDRDIVALSNGNKKLKTGIDKALEYINEHLDVTEYGEVILTHTFDKYNLKELEDILGSDKE